MRLARSLASGKSIARAERGAVCQLLDDVRLEHYRILCQRRSQRLLGSDDAEGDGHWSDDSPHWAAQRPYASGDPSQFFKVLFRIKPLREQGQTGRGSLAVALEP